MQGTRWIKQYGLKRTGTNLLRYLLEENFRETRVLVNILGWKHGPWSPEVDWTGSDWDIGVDPGTAMSALQLDELAQLRTAHQEGTLRYVASVKNPYAWLTSYFNFRRARGEIAARCFEAIPQKHFLYDLDLYIRTNQSYLELMARFPDRALLVRYEDILTDFRGTMNQLRDRLGLENLSHEYSLPRRRMGRGNDAVPHSHLLAYPESQQAFDPGHYLNHLYVQDFTSEQLEWIRSRVPQALMQALDYPIF